jgi:cellulose synthase operon protein YhjQ
MERQGTDRNAGNAKASAIAVDPSPMEEQAGGEVPEDVAILYSWANLQGGKYRDFSASRREYRAQMRRRAAEALREQELEAAVEAEVTAQAAESQAEVAEVAGQSFNNAAGDAQSEYSRQLAMEEAELAARRASAERFEAGRWAEAAALAESASLRADREIADAQASGIRQAAGYPESEERAQQSVPGNGVPARMRDPYAQQVSPEGEVVERPATADARYRSRGFRPDVPSGLRSQVRQTDPAGIPHHGDAALAGWVDSAPLPPAGYQAVPTTSYEEYRRSYNERPSNEVPLPPRQEARPSNYQAQPLPSVNGRFPSGNAHAPADSQPRNGSASYTSYPPLPPPPAATNGFHPLAASLPFHESAEAQRSGAVSTAPAWLYGAADGGRFQAPVQASPVATGETLQHSRERVAARWYALKGVFQQPGLDLATDLHPNRQNEAHTPILAVFSLAGGVGKTSLVATLGRALSSLGEQVLLADTTSHGLLPFYFGASELIAGVVRNFSPPPGSKDAPIHLVSYDVDRRGEIQTREDRRNEDAGAQDKLAADLLRDSQGTHRVLLDLPATSSWVVRRVARMNPTVLIPLAPDMNSVITLQSVYQFLQSILDADGHPLSPYFILNQFDPTLPLHIDVREVLRQQLGERLLPFVIHRAPAISEALAEGMTIIDYAPDSVAAQDYLNVATWIRSVSASTSAGFRHARWSER